MSRLTAILADATLPEVPGLNLDSPRPSANHLPPAFVGLAVFALLLVGYLLWDFCRQKHLERQQRLRLESFREKKLRESAQAAVLNEGGKATARADLKLAEAP